MIIGETTLYICKYRTINGRSDQNVLLPPGCVSSQSSHPGRFSSQILPFLAKTHLKELPPCVPVLVTDLLLHLGIGESLQEGAPNISLTLVPGKR